MVDVDLDEFMRGCRPSVRDLVEQFGGADAAVAFDADPLSAAEIVDDYLLRLPIREFETEDWVGLLTDVGAYLTVVLLDTYAGTPRARPDGAFPRGWEFVIDVRGADGQLRSVSPGALAHQYLVPIPQRIPRLLEAVQRAAGHGSA
ncbi:hypothetical protein H9Y04_24595 [Streptomyces sp. TRM66268-LWL]|uniref:Uncharacterized protein n=1 Tax=Streptomyces polyasparticus TaxID=2767826 RepID=A0ABR7SL42_9ACTN|nr:hypothetical protein [Streptomyces polyasparticus]MBC9715727.1 hypothetical protein [Streptomyces polyasparticus]